MPFCKYCHQEISKFDSDICPHCGEANPIDSGYKTMDFTKNFQTLSKEDMVLPKAKSQKVAMLLCIFLGYFGIHDFYILKPKVGLIELAVTILAVSLLGTIFFFTFLHNAFAYLIPFGVVWIYYIVKGLLLGRFQSLKDGNGEFLR